MYYYSRHLNLVEYKQIWGVIEAQSEYTTFMVPGDLNQSIQFVFNNPVKPNSETLLQMNAEIQAKGLVVTDETQTDP